MIKLNYNAVSIECGAMVQSARAALRATLAWNAVVLQQPALLISIMLSWWPTPI
jgi:hypothetical protein